MATNDARSQWIAIYIVLAEECSQLHSCMCTPHTNMYVYSYSYEYPYITAPPPTPCYKCTCTSPLRFNKELCNLPQEQNSNVRIYVSVVRHSLANQCLFVLDEPRHRNCSNNVTTAQLPRELTAHGGTRWTEAQKIIQTMQLLPGVPSVYRGHQVPNWYPWCWSQCTGVKVLNTSLYCPNTSYSEVAGCLAVWYIVPSTLTSYCTPAILLVKGQNTILASAYKCGVFPVGKSSDTVLIILIWDHSTGLFTTVSLTLSKFAFESTNTTLLCWSSLIGYIRDHS